MKFLTHFRFGMLLLFFLNVIGQSKAQDVWNAPNGVDVSIFAYGSDGLDIRWYGITVHHDRWSTDDWRFVYGDNSENDKVQGDEANKRPDYGSNANFVWSFQKVGNNNTNQTDIPICIWNRGAEGYISATTNKPEISKSFTVLRFSIPQQNDWKAFKLLFSSDWGNAAEIGKTLKVWKDGGALDFSANQMRPYKKDAYFRVYDAGWTDREAVIYAAMKNSVGAYAGASSADFTNIDTEYGKDILIRNFKKIRNDLATLQTKYNNQPTTLPSGFYRIRSGHSGFNGKSGNEERVMYVDSSNKKVKWKNGNQTDGIWRVIANNDGSYTLTHYNTGCTFTTPSKEAVLSGNAKVQIQPIYQQWFPGYYSISVSDINTPMLRDIALVQLRMAI